MRFPAAALTCAIFALASQTPAQSTQPTTAPAVSPQVDQTLNLLRDSYRNLNSLDLAGRLSFDSDIMATKESRSIDFTASFLSPNRFRHELKDQNLIISTGQKAYLYLPGEQQYLEDESPADRKHTSDLNDQIEQVLFHQNPSLSLAMSEDARAEVLEGVERIEQGENVQIDGKSFIALSFEQPENDTQMLIDPQTHLVRRITIDLRKSLKRQEVPAVERALVTVDYTTTTPNVAIDNSAFAWSPPASATPVRAGETPEGDHPLQGKAAPDFTLPDLAGQEVHLADLKGKVVVLDFWATWCGPCREGLPHLDKINTEMAAKGPRIFAVNLREDRAKAQKFVDETKLSLPVLLDAEGQVAEKYAVSGIPQTVVIGKDGVIRRVFVGFDPENGEAELRKAIESAMRE